MMHNGANPVLHEFILEITGQKSVNTMRISFIILTSEQNTSNHPLIESKVLCTIFWFIFFMNNIYITDNLVKERETTQNAHLIEKYSNAVACSCLALYPLMWMGLINTANSAMQGLHLWMLTRKDLRWKTRTLKDEILRAKSVRYLAPISLKLYANG